VSLTVHLGRLRTIADLRGLMAALGHEPLFEPAADLFARRSRAAGEVFAIGRAGEFPWFATTGAEPGRAARRLARRLALRGRVAGVLAIDGTSRRLGLAVAVEGVPSLELALDAPAPEALAGLSRLAGTGPGGALAYAARAADALSGEAVGRRFFREFKATLDRLTDGLPTTLRGEDRRSLALLQLTRVLFLYFIQAKGWLDGRERFLADEVDRCLARGRRIHRDLLRPLFFGTLNRPMAERGKAAAAFGAIPFLNGGLFEPHPLERRLRGDIPNPLWRDAFDRLFERFHFVVAEPGASGGIAPDMLGRVFEGVMAPDLRRASGTYYTPAALVRSILDSAVAALVAIRLRCGEGEAERRLSDRDPAAGALLADSTLLDPAAGSGAFLVGALERLASLTAHSAASTSLDRRRVLQRNLFGVDRSATAVRLTELRLWLAVIADDRTDRPERTEPLPNLDCLIRQGDSLFEPASAARLRAADPAAGALIAELRGRLVTATGRNKRDLARALRAAECRAAEAAFRAGEAHAMARIAACLGAARAPDLFGRRRGVDAELRAALGAARADLRALRGARRTLVREREVPWFHYQSQFADVFAAGGFDVVVGNPPWLRAEEIPAETRRRLSARYRWWRGSRAAFGQQPDLAVAFLERALELAAPTGVVAMLVSAKLATAGYGAAARHALASSTTLIRVADLTGRPDAAFDATVYPLALVVANAPPPHGHRVRTALHRGPAGRALQSTLAGGAPWVLTADRPRALLLRLQREHPTLGERFACHLGVKTGANHLFLDPTDVEPELLRWAVRGRDVRPFGVRPRVRLLWTHTPAGDPLPRLPPLAAARLEPHAAALRARADYTGGPTWTLFRTHAAASAHRVVWSDLARRLTACALTGRAAAACVPLNTCYVAPTGSAEEAQRLAAWLNSTWIRAVARAGAVPAASGFRRFSARTIGGVPLPDAAMADPELVVVTRTAAREPFAQEALDDLTARHLGLSDSDRRVLRRLVAGRAPDHR
jgi:hypothetical protein